MADRSLLAALAFLSAAVTAQQIALMQVLGWMHWHHFAYMIVAIALLGFGVAGTVLSLARTCLLERSRTVLPWLFLLTTITIPIGVDLAQLEVLAVDLPLVFFDPANHAWRLVTLCLLLFPPFFCSGLATGLILMIHARNAGTFYASSLAGAGLGGLLGIAFVALVIPPRLPAATAAIALFGTLSLFLGARRRTANGTRSTERPPEAPGLRSLTFTITLCGAALYLVAMWLSPMELRQSQFKPLSRTLDLPHSTIVASSPSVHGWIQIVDAPALRPSPAVSFAFEGEIPSHPAVFINGLGYGSLLSADSSHNPRWLNYTTDAAAFYVASPRNVLLLENGPGGWAALAAAQGADRVILAEPNDALINLLTETHPPLAPEWRLPSVQVLNTTGRMLLQRTTEAFDLIRFPSVGELGGSAGLASTSEQFLLTRQAFTEAWSRLTPGGVISVTSWMEFPERNSLRLLATLVEIAEAAGVSTRSHLVALRGWATVTFLLRRNAWTAPDIAAIRVFCEQRGFDPLLLPDLRADERDQYHIWQNPAFFDVVDRIVDGPRELLYREQPFSLRPATDDRPYFSQFFRWNGWDQISRAFGTRNMPFFELGSLTVGLTFVVLSLLAATGIVLPLSRLGGHPLGHIAVLLYFGGLGAGFMFVEMGLLLSAHAWLGSPILAAATVLTTLLIACGSGSLWSERWAAEPREQKRVLYAIVAGAVAVAALLVVLAPTARTWALLVQIAVLICLVAPVGIMMGMAFPIGLRRLESSAPSQIPWAWAINGCVSVATPPAAMLLAMSAGFTALFVAAATAYTLALASVILAAKHPASRSSRVQLPM